MNTFTQPIMEVRQLVKHYPKVKAVNGISFSIPAGFCFGLLGPNGAGKTTTIEMMEGITKPTSGEILFKGTRIGHDFRQKSGIQFQSTALQDYLTTREALQLFKSFYKTSVDMDYLIKLCALEDYIDRDTDRLSGGQKQRLLLAIALVNNPDVIFLDEPTTGLDPQARRSFWDLVQTIKAQKKTIIMTTHYMEEAYYLCDEIAIMDKGVVIAQGEPQSLLDKNFNSVILEIPSSDFTMDLQEGKHLWTIFKKDETVEIHTPQVNETIQNLIEKKISLAHLRIRSKTLEDLFLQLTGKELRE